MKKITLLCIAFMAFAFSFQANAQCDYTLEMFDSWGDGWDTGVMTVYADGVAIPGMIGVAAMNYGGGNIPSTDVLTFTVTDGQDITTTMDAQSTYPGEVSYRILDNIGTQVGIGNSTNDITTGTITVLCQSCMPATGIATVVPDCANGMFSVDVDVTGLGDSATVFIVDSSENILGQTMILAVVTVGPFPIGTPMDLYFKHESNAGCDVLIGSYDYGSCNDDCNSSIPLNCGDDVSFDTTTATLDNDVFCGTDSFSPNVWYTYQATATPELVTLSTCGIANYDTKLYVYSGVCGSLVCVANNDDFTGCALYTSELEFITEANTLYRIAVSGYSVAPGGTGNVSAGMGNLTITCEAAVTPPDNNLCAGAEPLTFGVPVTGDNTNATAAAGNPSCDQNGVISDLWYTFDGPLTGEVTLTTTIGTANNAWIAVYDACGGTELGCASGALIGGGTGSDGLPGGKQLELSGLTSGTPYYVQVWNDGAALRTGARTEGTFDIVVLEGLLSTEDFDASDLFTYYPNPVNNTLSLKAQNTIQNVSIFNMLGQEVLRTSPNTIVNDVDTSALQSGAYFVKVTIDNISETVRIIKQ